MRNRAKCKLCNDIIESFHPTDLVYCSCGQIGVDGGFSLRCMADDWRNFIRVDDEGNEIIPKVLEETVTLDLSLADLKENESQPDKQQLLDMLGEMIKSYEALPQAAMSQPITHYDLLSVLLLFSAILRSSDS